MPVGGVCVTAEREHIEVLRAEAAKRGCRLVEVDPESVTDEEMRGFGWVTFKENVAIALAVAELLGVARRPALQGMWAAPPDPGVLSVREYAVNGKRLARSPTSSPPTTRVDLDERAQLLERGDIRRPLHVVINCRPGPRRAQRPDGRADRADRPGQDHCYWYPHPQRHLGGAGEMAGADPGSRRHPLRDGSPRRHPARGDRARRRWYWWAISTVRASYSSTSWSGCHRRRPGLGCPGRALLGRRGGATRTKP